MAMKNRFNSYFALLTVVIGFIFLNTLVATTAGATASSPSQESPSIPVNYSALPPACQVVYQSKAKALRSCPPKTPVIEWFDFWQKTRLGWACDCSKLDQK